MNALQISVAAVGDAICRFAANLGLGVVHDKRLSMFRDILREHDDLIARLCLGYAQCDEDFEDLRQDAYANIWQGLANFRGKAKMTTWIYRVTLNTCVSTIHGRSKTGQKISIDSFADIIDDNAEHRRALADLHEAIAMLPPIDKAIVLMWLDEVSYEEIAEIMGMKTNTVGARLHRAKDKLRKIMER